MSAEDFAALFDAEHLPMPLALVRGSLLVGFNRHIWEDKLRA